MKVLILGGDGYLGWPTAMNLASSGHEVMVVDNYLKRKIFIENDLNSIDSGLTLKQRVDLWNERCSSEIHCKIGDLKDWNVIAEVFELFQPDSVIHYAEQPSAPYSMLSRASADLTVSNNIMVTFNVIQAIAKYTPEAHLIKLGTMGEYGTPNIDIEEGWLTVEHKGRSSKFLYPRQASSLYHTTKVMDTDLLWFYVRVWGLKVTDLMQGPVYGIYTPESKEHEELMTTFCYDEMFGTVLNRFIAQAVKGFPLTVYGKGEQTRGYLNLVDTLQCVKLCVENPVEKHELRVLNQFTETFTVNDLAEKVKLVGDRLGLDVKIQNIENPRKEMEEHYYNPAHTGLTDLGLKPNLLTDDVIEEMILYVSKYKESVDDSRFLLGAKWKK